VGRPPAHLALQLCWHLSDVQDLPPLVGCLRLCWRQAPEVPQALQLLLLLLLLELQQLLQHWRPQQPSLASASSCGLPWRSAAASPYLPPALDVQRFWQMGNQERGEGPQHQSLLASNFCRQCAHLKQQLRHAISRRFRGDAVWHLLVLLGDLLPPPLLLRPSCCPSAGWGVLRSLLHGPLHDC
jgi:hypothetical protein